MIATADNQKSIQRGLRVDSIDSNQTASFVKQDILDSIESDLIVRQSNQQQEPFVEGIRQKAETLLATNRANFDKSGSSKLSK